jgi:hypothetical protein
MADPAPAVVLDVLREHPEAVRIYSEDAADWITDRELSPSYFSGPDTAVMLATINRHSAVTEWFRSLGFELRDIVRSPLYSGSPLGDPALNLPPLHWSARCTERQRASTS